MNIFDIYTRNLLEQLNDASVEYLIVGGYAVNYYGYRRTTGDIDLWIKPDNKENKLRFIKALRNLGIDEVTLQRLMVMDFSTPLVFSDGEEPFRIDFMTHIQGVNFNEAWKKRELATIDELQVAFIHKSHLVLSKISSTRMKDKLDIEELQKISDQGKPKNKNS